MKIRKTIFSTIVIVGFALIASTVVFIKSYSSPNVKAPFVQSVSFTMIVFLFAWLVLGRPGFKKKRTTEETIQKLLLKGFYETASSNPHFFETADKVVCLQKDYLFIEFASYASASYAQKEFVNIETAVSRTAETIIYTHEKRKGDYQEYALQTSRQSYVICLDNQQITLFHSNRDNIKEINSLIKTISK